MSGVFYGSQRITIVGTGMNHGRHLAEVLGRLGDGKDVRLLAKAPPQRSRRAWVFAVSKNVHSPKDS